MLRRGFKSWSEKTSVSYRHTLGLNATDPMCPKKLACHLSVSVWSPQDIPGIELSVLKTLTGSASSAWSAVTLCRQGRHLIVLNTSHAVTRQTSDLMHELSHIIIGHNPTRVDISEDGLLLLNSYDKNQEEEAEWLSGALLIPREALLMSLAQSLDNKEASKRFGVSEVLFRWRVNATGVKTQMTRAKSARVYRRSY